jgi:hypothetical protein
MLTIIQEYINDFGVFFGWVGEILHTIISTFILPLNFVFTYIKAFLIHAFNEPIATGMSYTWNGGVMSVFHSLPYWNYIQDTLFLGISIIFAMFILKVLTKI